MLLISSIPEMQRTADELRSSGKQIAFVPTMGALHEGHLELIRTAAQHCESVVVSVFVNPSQFGKNEDLATYPRDLERDTLLATEAGATVLFFPEVDEMYPEAASTWVQVDGLSLVLEGAFRPTHFRGVATVVASLFNIVKPHIAVFGQKDAQQVLIVRRMIRDLHFDVNLIIVPTIREIDGLAMSSRNLYLSEIERNKALAISRSLRLAEDSVHGGEWNADTLRSIVESELLDGGMNDIDYIALVDTETLEDIEHITDRPALLAVAVRVGTTRLIDNTILQANLTTQ